MNPPEVNNEDIPTTANVKRGFDATAVQHTNAFKKRTTKATYGGAHSILNHTILPAVLTADPQDTDDGPQSIPGAARSPDPLAPATVVTHAQLEVALEDALAPLTAAVAPLTASVAALTASVALLVQMTAVTNAGVANNRIRANNRRLFTNQQWIPLQREVAQGAGDVAVGAIPAADLIPLRNLPEAPPNQTVANLQALSNHYGVAFATWQEFFDYLQW